MMRKAFLLALLATPLFLSFALASSFDGMSVEDVRAHPDFVASDYSLCSATNSGDPDAPHIYWWIGYIPDGDKRVYFTSYAEPLTCVEFAQTGEWVPEWVHAALVRLLEEGLITGLK